jgi:hypothetical protein
VLPRQFTVYERNLLRANERERERDGVRGEAEARKPFFSSSINHEELFRP